MNKMISNIKNENGVVLITAILILAILMLLGVTGITTSNTEKNIAVNEQIYKMTFYTAEAGQTYAIANSKKDTIDDRHLTGVNNSDIIGTVMYFPDKDDSSVVYPPEPDDDPDLTGLNLSFNGSVVFEGTKGFPSPRGAGYQIGGHLNLVPFWYTVTSNGYGPRNAQVQITAGGYRIGPEAKSFKSS